jgi:hypothetical protein
MRLDDVSERCDVQREHQSEHGSLRLVLSMHALVADSRSPCGPCRMNFERIQLQRHPVKTERPLKTFKAADCRSSCSNSVRDQLSAVKWMFLTIVSSAACVHGTRQLFDCIRQ